jgi:hypothetical protein
MFCIRQFKNQDQQPSANRAKRRGIALLRWPIIVLIFVIALGFILGWVWCALPKIAIAEISELAGCNVDTEFIDFKLNGSVSIGHLVIRPPYKQQYDNAILKAKTVYARFSLGSLLLLGPRIKEIRIDDFVFNAQYDLDTNQWNLEALKFNIPKGSAGNMPLIVLGGGMLQYSKVSKGQATVLGAIPINMNFRPAKEILGGYSFDITTAEKADGDLSAQNSSQKRSRSRLVGSWLPGKITVAGGISSAGIPASENAWVIDTLDAVLNYDRDRNFLLKLKIKNLSCPNTSDAEALAFNKSGFFAESVLLTSLQSFFNKYRPTGKVDIDMELSGNFSQLSKSAVTGKVLCKDVTICDRRFPYTIEQMTGQVDFTENSAILNNLSGKHGDVEVAVAGWVKDFGPDQRYQIQITSDNMALDDDLYEALNLKQKEFWTAFSPSGLAAINYRFSRSALNGLMEKRKLLEVDLRGSEAAYRRFPYPLKNLKGKLYFDSDSITVADVVSQANGEGSIICNGKVIEYNTDNPIYNLSIKASDMPFDPTLVRSLLAEQGTLYNQFDMSGLADADIRIFTPTEDTATASSKVEQASAYNLARTQRASFFADVTLKQAYLKANKSGLVISDVSAKVHLTPDSTNIKNFTGQYGQSQVSLVGGIWLTDKPRLPRYYLAIGAKQAQLSEELIGLLPKGMAKVVSEFRPTGEVGISANFRKMSNDERPGYSIVVDCLDDSINFKRFTYPLKDVTGRITITNNKVMFDEITATPADSVQETNLPLTDSTIKLNGQIVLADNTFNNGIFRLSARDISLGEFLVCALPANISSFYQALSPAGRFDLDLGNVKVFKVDDGEKLIDFTATAGFNACNFNMSGARAELDAVLKVKGLYKTGDGLSDGQIAVFADNFKFKGKSITNMRMDLNYEPHLRRWLAEGFVADCYDGRLTGKLEISPASGGQEPAEEALEYLLQIAFDNIDLRQFLSSEEPNHLRQAKTDYTSGTMSGSLSLGARIGDNSSRLGRCRLAIRDMQVGKLSPLAKLLYVLRLTEPKDFAFERMVVDSYIRADTLLFDVFDLSGETVAFQGSGSLNLRNADIGLSLTARGRRLAGAEPSFLGSLTEGLGKAVVRMVVTGNVNDPKVEIKTLPVVEDSLKILGTPR